MDVKRVGIVGTGSFVPEHVLTNFDLEKMVDTTDEWIRTRTGIVERHVASRETSSSDLGVEAARQALKDSAIDPKEIDLIITATITPDMFFPSTACLIQSRLDVPHHIPSFDLSAACSGFVYALEVGRQFILNGTYKTILVVACDTLSKITDWKDRSTCVLLADGAGSAILKEVKGDFGILSTHLAADGRGQDLLHMPGGGSRYPATHETVERGLHFLKMKGNELFKIGVRLMARITRQALSECGLTEEDVSLLIMHQANIRILEAVAKRLEIPMEKVFVNIHKYGNTSAASCAIALDEAVREDRIKEGDIIVLCTMGAGLTWAAMVIRWGGIQMKGSR
ncbi:MAG: beta-ketoacyl-ACP synthase III [bacterium]|nr:beta-ketoacyl-ACP synthase III [bacterium]